MHIPKGPTAGLELALFEPALQAALQPSPDYDAARWLYVPNTYSEYRYILGTRGKKPLICVGINPSTAAPDALDPTLQSAQRIALANGYDSFLMFNVYAQRATRPDDMEHALNPALHAENRKAFRYLLSLSDQPAVWAAWGSIIEKRAYLSACVADMLEIAMEKRIESGHDILYLLQNMQEFELYGTVRAIVSVCDCVNYVTEKNELQEVFRLVNNYLDPQGIFIFDFNTEYKYREVLGNQVIAEDRDECSFIWENYYNHTSMINEYELTLFVREDEEAALYRKYQESHFQKAYTLREMRGLLEKAGLKFVAAYDAYTKKAPMYTSERIT